jgi:hypothetical protein
MLSTFSTVELPCLPSPAYLLHTQEPVFNFLGWEYKGAVEKEGGESLAYVSSRPRLAEVQCHKPTPHSL